MTEFHVEVVRIGPVTKHPNADRLEFTTVHADENGQGGYPVIFQAGSFKEGDRAVYVPVDAVVPETEEWSWLWEGTPNPPPRKRRIKAKKLRGIFSMGLLTKVPETHKYNRVGVDLAEAMGITKYEDPAESEGPAPIRRGQSKKLPWYTKAWRRVLRWFGFAPPAHNNAPAYGLEPPALKYLPGYFDIEPFRRFSSWFQSDEDVVILEKIHGQNASYVVDAAGKLHMKSRTRWRENNPTDASNAWARAAERYDLGTKLARVPGIILYGEVYGNFSDLPYGASKEGPGFVAFDAYDSNTGKWLDWPSLVDLTETLVIPRVPLLARRAWTGNASDYFQFAEGKTTLAGHVREGFVIKPVSGRTHNGGQRVILKLHGEGFLTRKDPGPLPDGKPIQSKAQNKTKPMQYRPRAGVDVQTWTPIGEAA